MKRTTIMIPEDLKAKALNRASMLGISFGGFVRESIERALKNPNFQQSGRGEDPFFADDAVFRGDAPDDLALNHDEYLYGEND